MTNEITRERTKLEEFKRSSFFDVIVKLAAPACVAVGSEVLAL